MRFHVMYMKIIEVTGVANEEEAKSIANATLITELKKGPAAFTCTAMKVHNPNLKVEITTT